MEPYPSATIEQVRILIVDDHPSTATTLARALTQLGPSVDIVSATNGLEALEKVKNKGVDILITDMIMPEMTGLELIEKMQNHPGGRPAHTYLVTAYDVPGLKVTAQRLKVDEVLIKPVRPERIYQIVARNMEDMKHSTNPIKSAGREKRKFKILVADDRPDNVTLLARYLDYEGYDHVSAQDGLETLIKVQDEMPDLVLLDINMPNKDGFTVLEEIRANPALEHIPVIILTAARLDPADVREGLNLGADDYITKPFDRHELMARIRTKLRVKEAEDVIRRRNRELSLLPEIGKDLSARLDIQEIANVVLKRTAETFGALEGHMLLLDTDGNTVERYKISLTSEDNDANQIELDKSFFNRIVDTHQGMIIKNTKNDPHWKSNEGNPTRSAVVAPLFGRRELLGFLLLTQEMENYFTLEQLLLLQAIASQAAIAIENVRLYENVTQEQKRLERVKNEFIATASHDLKNPIMSISGYSDLLSKAGPLNSQQQDFVGYIQSSARNMLELVQNMLQLTEIDLQQMEDRLETLEPVKLLVETINEFQIMAQEKNLSLELRGEDTHILIEGNPLQIRQVYSNLIGNAIKYTPAGGSVVISIQRLDQTLEVQIQDTGYGIPAADLPFIFDRFYRVRSGKASDIEGNGLGLAIVKSIVERHKGKIMVQSEMERGSTFCVSLPISESNSSIS
ncbi:MAG: response regulator [Anaerolineales bacterium]|nr:response regulator [Anaerolineales bacterium]